MDLYILNRIRPYKTFSLCKLLRVKTFFFLCKFNKVVKNLNLIYNTSVNFFGKNFTNKIIDHMYCDFLTGGSKFDDLEKALISLQDNGMYSSIAFCREFLTKNRENDVESIIDAYYKSIDLAIKVNKDNTVSIKVSSLCEIENLKLYNKIQNVLSIIEDSFVNNDSMEKIKTKLNSYGKIAIDDTDINFLKSIRTTLGLNLMELFARNASLDLQCLSKIFACDMESLKYGNLFYTRLHRILSYSLKNKCSILYDAEQSYIQRILDSSAQYFSFILNKDFPTILETVQCYLKDSPQKIDYFIKFYRENNLKLGFKIVRGAYLVEETKLSSENHSERLIWDTIEETHSNYNDIMRKLVLCYREGDKIIFASHNEDTVLLLTDLIEGKSDILKDIYCAQLIGISDHITLLCKHKGLKTIKYLSFGEIDIMIPYLIRRAEETSIITKLQIQTKLLNQEILLRLKLPFYFITFLVIMSIGFK